MPFDIAVAEYPYTQRRYQAFTTRARGAGLVVWPVDQAFRGRRVRDLMVNTLDGHPNELGHRLAAREVLPQVVAALEDAARRGSVPARGAGRP